MDKHPDFHGGEFADVAPAVRPAILKEHKRPGFASRLIVWATLAALSWSFALGLVWCVVKITRTVFGSLGWS